MPDICVVHLVWKPLGLEPFREFIESYRRHAAGAEHRLVLVFNGFSDEHETRDYRELTNDLAFETFFISTPAHDIEAYFKAARRLQCEYLCFLNSYSVLLDRDWLAKMYAHATRADVGVVGATGSWQSGYSYVLFEQGRPSAYTELLRDYYTPRPKRELFTLSHELRERIRQAPFFRRLALRFYYWCLVAPFYLAVNGGRFLIKDSLAERALRSKFFHSFDPFPTPHVRTNAFMIRRAQMLDLRRPPIVEKLDAYMFESGKEGMTSQILRAGLEALVVGRDGRAYEPEEWHLSDTLWQGEQEHLLVSDNQTSDYANGSPQRRIFLSRVAWGDKARPSLEPRSLA
jgi:hypothetical protein